MDKNSSTRTITIYMPDYAEKEIHFFSVSDKSLNSQSKGATFPTNYTVLDTEGRGEVDLSVPLTGEIQYRCEAPNGVIRTGYLAYASEPLALFDWMVIGVSDYLLAANNLSDLQSAAAAQLNLALLPGTYVLAYYAALDDLGLLTNTTGAADKLPYMDGALSFALADLTAFMRTLLDDADAATARATLGAAAAADIPDELTDLDTAVTGAELDADHSKLAGIESGATADQTAAEILTAIKTVDGTGSGLDADLLDGSEAAAFVKTDGSSTISETVTQTAAGDEQLLSLSSTLNPSSASAVSLSNLYSQLYIPSANAQNFSAALSALRFLSIHDGSGTATYMNGASGEVWARNSAVITAMSGFYGRLNIESSAAATVAAAFKAGSPSGTGGATCAAGLYVENQGRSGVTVANGILIDAQSGASVNNAISTNGGKVSFNQASATGAIPVIELTQADVSEELIEITSTAGTGNAVEAVGAKTLTTTEFLKITVNGSTRYIPCGTIA